MSSDRNTQQSNKQTNRDYNFFVYTSLLHFLAKFSSIPTDKTILNMNFPVSFFNRKLSKI